MGAVVQLEAQVKLLGLERVCDVEVLEAGAALLVEDGVAVDASLALLVDKGNASDLLGS